MMLALLIKASVAALVDEAGLERLGAPPAADPAALAGDTVAPEDPLITLEFDKPTMDVPSPAAGVVDELRIVVVPGAGEWMGLTETEAKVQGVTYEKRTFPWAASVRALSLGCDDGSTKLLIDPETLRVLGVNAGELIAETVHALELGSDEDIGLTIHYHPTLSESIDHAAEAAEGTITDFYLPERPSRAAASVS